MFALLWGYPFLVVGEGRSPGTAAGFLTLLVVVGMGVGPLLGRLCGRWPLRRSVLVFGILGATVTRGPSCCCGRAGRRCLLVCWSWCSPPMGRAG